jgi:hypothetical protein
MPSIKSTANATGFSRTTVVIGLLIFMFIVFTLARGTFSQYISLLFTTQAKATANASAPTATTVNSQSWITPAMQQSNPTAAAMSNAIFGPLTNQINAGF